MDPDATLFELLNAVELHDWDRVHELAQALTNWILRGGFPLRTIGSKNLDREWHRTIALLICRVADSRATISRQSNIHRAK